MTWSAVATNGLGQQWGSISGGRGTLSIHSVDLDRFVDTFNRASAGTLVAPVKDFNRASGWHFDVGYETVFGNVSTSLNSGLHRYSTTNDVRFLSGAGHQLELTVQDLTASWEILIYQGYLFFGPGLWISNRRVTLDSRESSPGSPLAGIGLAGEYSGSSFELRWGGVGGVWWGPFRLSVRVLHGGRSLGEDDRLFDGDSAKLGTDAAYFPADYEAFTLELSGGRRNVVRSNVRGRIVEFAVAIFFPL